MITAEKNAIASSEMQLEWMQAIDAFYRDVEKWAKEWLTEYDWSPTYGWDVMVTSKQLQDNFSYHYESVSVLEINALVKLMKLPPEQRLVLEQKLVLAPMSLNLTTETGRVDFYAWPTHYRVRLLYSFVSREWLIKTDSGLNWPHAWSKETFIELAEGLLRA